MQSQSELPDWIKNKPDSPEGLEFYLDSFFELGTERQIGFGCGPIPINSILSYAVHHGINDCEQNDFVYIIRELDSAYLKYQEAKSQREKPKNGRS